MTKRCIQRIPHGPTQDDHPDAEEEVEHDADPPRGRLGERDEQEEAPRYPSSRLVHPVRRGVQRQARRVVEPPPGLAPQPRQLLRGSAYRGAGVPPLRHERDVLACVIQSGSPARSPGTAPLPIPHRAHDGGDDRHENHRHEGKQLAGSHHVSPPQLLLKAGAWAHECPRTATGCHAGGAPKLQKKDRCPRRAAERGLPANARKVPSQAASQLASCRRELMKTPTAAFDMAASHVTAAPTSTRRHPALPAGTHRGQPARPTSMTPSSAAGAAPEGACKRQVLIPPCYNPGRKKITIVTADSPPRRRTACAHRGDVSDGYRKSEPERGWLVSGS